LPIFKHLFGGQNTLNRHLTQDIYDGLHP